MNKVTPFLMFNNNLDAALALYTSVFPDTKVLSRSGQSAEFTVGGQRFMAFDGGPHFKFSDGFSVFVSCEDQEEVDRYWNALLTAGSKPTMCGWINDPFGLAWQIVPKRLMELMADKDPKRAKAVVQAMLKMQKLDVAGLEQAHREARA
jgi:predicted 3-demethylubiquinone-9 3-methyltransferase (glyoxalase superfamily)